MKVILETERLLLREILPTDLDGMFELDSDPEVHRYLGNRPATNKKQLEEVIAFIRQQYADNGVGRWAIVGKSTNEFMGWAGLKWVEDTINQHTHYYDLGYRLNRKYWGQGIATESAIASLNYGFRTLELTEIMAAAHVENQASNKVLKKVGFHQVETFVYDNAEHHWYTMNRGDWESKRSGVL